MGHALDTTLQDIVARSKRMQGFETLYLPGTDHASIATEARVVAKLKEDTGKSKTDIGREAFLDLAWEWKDKYGSAITQQLKRLGISCDWDRERFTLDEGLSNAVLEVFVNLYNEGLIYRGRRMVNWCPNCVTNISDIEVEYEDRASNLWHIRYPLEDGSGYLEVATTRPETMLGDTAVAVNPDDARYADIIGKYAILPIVNRRIPVIADDYVSSEFGTGQVKITPAHDPNDFAMGERHNLDFVEVINEHGIMNENALHYSGQSREDARKNIVKELEELGFLVEIEDYQHNVGTCSRCGTVIEPRASVQWFVKMEDLAKPAVEAVRDGEIKFVPEYMDKTYYNWMENIQDWTISRQLWWGHRIPAYYCQTTACDHIYVGKEAPSEACPKCGGSSYRQDEDTLDTWFSSALWPFSTLGWPEDTADFKKFYPSNTMATGTDLIFFWVARMIFSGIKHTGEIPFDTVYFHGMVRDELGRKMSKSLDNGVDPIEIIDEYGTDALRYSVVNGTAPGNDQRFRVETVEAGRAFATKMWNAFRFVMMNLEEDVDYEIDRAQLKLEDKWILSRLNSTIEEVSRNLENYELGVALASVYQFIWDEFCDWYIEMSKPRLSNKEDASRSTAQAILVHVLSSAMKLLHPFMPFITSEIYAYLNKDEDIIVAAWPEYNEAEVDKDAEKNMSILFDAIRQIRHLRTENEVKPKKRIAAFVRTDSEEISSYFDAARAYLDSLAGVDDLTVGKDAPSEDIEYSTLVFSGGEISIPSADITDPVKEKARLESEKEKLESELAHSEKVLSNENFVARAPEAVVGKEREKLADAKSRLESVLERLEKIS